MFELVFALVEFIVFVVVLCMSVAYAISMRVVFVCVVGLRGLLEVDMCEKRIV